MPTYTQSNYSTRQDVYTEVTDYIVTSLERGDIIWNKPWNSYGLPKNATGCKPYRGWNAFLLNFICLIKNYSIPYFITYLQAQQLGGNVKKGERGCQIIYWASVRSKYQKVLVVDEHTGQETEVSPTIRVPKLHTVFNIAQTEGISFAIDETLKRSHTEKIEACEQIIAGMPQQPAIHHSGDSACYFPTLDEVYMPEQSLFLADESYYSTLFHELAHSTGHQSRLNREEVMKTDRFGGAVYSQEELTAELTAAYLCGVSGIKQKSIDNSAAYIKGYLSKLKNDNKFFLKAARQARAAADYILNQPQDENTTTTADTNTVAAL